MENRTNLHDWATGYDSITNQKAEKEISTTPLAIGVVAIFTIIAMMVC